MAQMIFVNLPVQDLQRAVDFYTSLGYTQNLQFTDANASAIMISDEIAVMLLVEPFFATFTQKTIADTSTTIETINALSADSREAADRLADTALANGGSPARPPEEEGGMYGRSFHDPDGHLWEVVYMDPAALEQ